MVDLTHKITAMTRSPLPEHPRRRVIETLARASREEAANALAIIGEPAGWRYLRPPEMGLVMVRGRTGGGGSAFNLGEATVTRASVVLADGTVGHAYALGRDKQKAQATALLDALWQAGQSEAVEMHVLRPVEERLLRQCQREEEEAAATTVEFFTMARETQ